MENNEQVNVTEVKEEQKSELGFGTKVAAIAIAGGVKQLASRSTYVLGVGAGLLYGKRAGLKTIGTIAAIGAVYNAARYVTGDLKLKGEKSGEI